jgi:hypothetical protein
MAKTTKTPKLPEIQRVEISVTKEQQRAFNNIDRLSKRILELGFQKADIERELENCRALIKAERDIATGLVGHPFL